MHTLENPCDLDGFAFLEFSSRDPQIITQTFKNFQFQVCAENSVHDLEVWQQNNIVFLHNKIPESQASEHAKIHHSGPCAMGFKVTNAQVSHEIALNRGAVAAPPHPKYKITSIQGNGGCFSNFFDVKF